MMIFMITGDDSIAFRLVDAGFDVWLNNTRGNRFSKEHQFLDFEHPAHGRENINLDITR